MKKYLYILKELGIAFYNTIYVFIKSGWIGKNEIYAYIKFLFNGGNAEKFLYRGGEKK